MPRDSVYQRLLEKIEAERLIPDCDTRDYTSFKAGGNAALLVIPGSMEELRHALQVLSRPPSKYTVIGNGSNILVRDSGYAGTIVKLGGAFSSVKTEGELLTAGAGALMAAAAKAAMEAGLSGFEFAAGIPGSMGGAVFMNAGAYGGETRDVAERAEILSIDGQRLYALSADELKFGYRSSVLQETGDVAVSVTLRLKRGDPEEIRKKTRLLAERRNESQPVSMPSAGSFFKRPEGHFAGKLIQDAGLRGVRVGGARVSPLHAGFIVNQENATASDIIDLMNLVRNTVYDKFGVTLEPEVRILGD